MKTILATIVAILMCANSSADAGNLDLTTAGSSGTLNGLATDFFQQIDEASTGTGVIESFVRISTNQTTVQGYNTDARPLQFDENSSPQFTRSLLLSAVPIVEIAGIEYRQFLLDINQQGVDPLLSLNELQIFLGNTGSPSGATVGGDGTLSFGAQASLIYDMDANEDNTIELNYNLNTGSGSGDMFAYVDADLFTGGTHVTLYSKFGTPNGNNDGFEEWAVFKLDGDDSDPGPLVPEPASILLLTLGGLGLLGYRRRRRGVNANAA